MLQALKNKSKKIASTLAAGVLLFSQFAVVPSVGATNVWPPTDPGKVGICHATSSNSNPYTQNAIDKSSADEDNNKFLNGHGDHKGPVWFSGIDEDWGDIIPPFTSDKGTVFPGRNWTEAGQVIWNNDCSAKGSIKVIKDAQPNSTDDFDFEIKKGQTAVSSFELEDDGDNNDNQKDNKTVSDLSAGTYVITEDPDESGWVVSNIVCDTENYTVDLANKKVTLALGVAENVTCTFVNTPAPTYGSVKVSKKVDNGNGSYTSANGDQHPFLWGLDNEATDNLMGSTQSNVLTGTHTINENTVSGYAFTGWYYTGDESKSCTNPRGTTLPVTVEVEKNKTKEVTLCNKLVKGEIKVFKHTDPAGDKTKFDIEATTEDGTVYGNASREIADGESETFTVGTGTYSINETVPAGWAQTDNTCVDITIDAKNPYAECHIHNTKKAKLTIVKDSNPEDGQDFVFTSNKLGNFTLDVDDDDTYDDRKEFNSLTAGEYTVTEQAVAGWKLVDVDCKGAVGHLSEDGLTLTVSLDAGDDVTCYFYNVKQNTISGHKFNDVNGNHVWDEGEPALANWTITLTKECDVEEQSVARIAECENESWTDTTDENGAYSFTNLKPGTYTVCEVQQTNWTQTFPEDNDGCYEVVIEGFGEDITADFGNKAKPQVLGEEVTLVVTGASAASKSLIVGLSILGALGALHLLVSRRKDYAK